MAENRYRKIEVRLWTDEKFRALSPLQPCAQALWLFLLTGPHTGPLPGLFRAGRAALAEELGWSMEAFDKAFDEIFFKGMAKADWAARVVWIPNAIKCNPPQSPNVVISWAGEWNLIPECDLKRDAYTSFESTICSFGDAFGKAFAKAFGKACGKPLLKSCPNQEQEQEQEQEQKKNSADRANAHSRFVPPSIEEVSAYCKQRGNRVDPHQWYDHYLSVGWKVGKNAMKDWKASVRTWERRNGHGNGSAGHANRAEQMQDGNLAAAAEAKRNLELVS